MGHCICGVILKGAFDRKLAKTYDLRAVHLGFYLNLFHIDHDYTAWWQNRLGVEGELESAEPRWCVNFPTEAVVGVLMSRITGRAEPLFAVIVTDYFGGIGSQWARVYRGSKLVDPSIESISPALRYMGVEASPGLDEFDTVGLSRIRCQPDFLRKYADLARELDL